MRWLLIGLLISVGALVLVAGAVARHVRRQRQAQAEAPQDALEAAPELDDIELEDVEKQ
jgi:hypothetical protein